MHGRRAWLEGLRRVQVQSDQEDQLRLRQAIPKEVPVLETGRLTDLGQLQLKESKALASQPQKVPWPHLLQVRRRDPRFFDRKVHFGAAQLDSVRRQQI